MVRSSERARTRLRRLLVLALAVLALVACDAKRTTTTTGSTDGATTTPNQSSASAPITATPFLRGTFDRLRQDLASYPIRFVAAGRDSAICWSDPPFERVRCKGGLGDAGEFSRQVACVPSAPGVGPCYAHPALSASDAGTERLAVDCVDGGPTLRDVGREVWLGERGVAHVFDVAVTMEGYAYAVRRVRADRVEPLAIPWPRAASDIPDTWAVGPWILHYDVHGTLAAWRMDSAPDAKPIAVRGSVADAGSPGPPAGLAFVSACAHEHGYAALFQSGPDAIVAYAREADWWVARAAAVRLFTDPDPVWPPANMVCDGDGAALVWVEAAPASGIRAVRRTRCSAGRCVADPARAMKTERWTPSATELGGKLFVAWGNNAESDAALRFALAAPDALEAATPRDVALPGAAGVLPWARGAIGIAPFRIGRDAWGLVRIDASGAVAVMDPSP